MSYGVYVCPYTYVIQDIVKVVDGDTLDVTIDLGFDIYTKQRVRLLGIDCEESRSSDIVEKQYGKLAKEKLKYWCTMHTHENPMVLRCEKRDPREKFGRVLAELWHNELNINEWLVSNHFAVSYNGQSKDDIRMEHMKNREYVKCDFI